MQILNNNISNTNFTGAFRIKPQDVKAKAEIPAMFTQGKQVFHNVLEKGDEVIVLRDNYDKRVGKYIQENGLTNLEYYPKINTKSGLDDEQPEGLIQLMKDKTAEIKTELEDIVATISGQKGIRRPKKFRAEKEVKKIANALRLNIENPEITTSKNVTRIRDNQKGRTIEVIATNPATSYVYVKPDSLNEDSTKCIINTQGQVVKRFETPKDITKFMKKFKEMKESGVNILV